jgi:replicative DNA helicase
MANNRVQPHSEEAEKSVLGAALQSKMAASDLVETLVKEDFYRKDHGEIYEAIARLTAEGKPVDLVTVTDELRTMGMLDFVGGPQYLVTLSGMVPSPSNAAFYARTILEKATLRKLIEKSGDIINLSYGEGEKAEDVLEHAESEILSIAKRSQKSDYYPLNEVLSENIRRIEERGKLDGAYTGLPTGFKHLDDITLGLQPSDMIVLAARPGQGKTSLALNIAVNIALTGAKVLVFSLEMSKGQLGERVLSTEAMVDSKEIRSGKAYRDTEKFERIVEASVRLSGANLFIDDKSGISIAEIKNKCRRQKQKGGLDLVVVDYLQLMDFGVVGRAASRPENRQQEVSTLSRMLKQLAREMECPVLVLSQLSRDIEKGGNRKPRLSDLRESGAIEQDADIVMFIHEPESKEDDAGPDPDETRMLTVAKHRNGETGSIVLRWVNTFTKFGTYNKEDDIRTLI